MVGGGASIRMSEIPNQQRHYEDVAGLGQEDLLSEKQKSYALTMTHVASVDDHEDGNVSISVVNPDYFEGRGSKAREPDFYTKRVVAVHGERMLVSLKCLCEKMELLAVIPQIMSKLALGDFDLENVLGEECTDALIQLLFIQMRWIEAQSGTKFRFLGKSINQIKRRLQMGISTPSPLISEYPLIVDGEKERRKSIVRISTTVNEANNDTANTGLEKAKSRTSILKKKSITKGQENTDMEEEAEDDEEEEGEQSSDGSSSYSGESEEEGGGFPFAEAKCGAFSVLAKLFDNPQDIYRGEYLKAGYREVLRLLSLNEPAIEWFRTNLKPEVSPAVKIFYTEVQVLQGLMYARLLMTPDEEIKRIHFLKQTWIREQRLLNLYDSLKVEYFGLSAEKEHVMGKLNGTINQLIAQIDNIFQIAHQEINKISAEANKINLMTSKAFDQELQQLDTIYQRAFQFASNLRFKLGEDENVWRKKRFKLQSELEALIDRYDVEMSARQELLDDLEKEETKNRTEWEGLEKQLEDVEKRHGAMLEELRLKELERLAKTKKKKKKKKGKGKGGKKGKGKKKKGKKGAAAAGKKEKKGKKKGEKKGKKKKGKKGERSETQTEGEEEGEFDETEGEWEGEGMPPPPPLPKPTKKKKLKKKGDIAALAPPPKPKKKKKAPAEAKGAGKGKGQGAKGKGGKKKVKAAPPPPTSGGEEEGEQEMIEQEDEDEEIEDIAQDLSLTSLHPPPAPTEGEAEAEAGQQPENAQPDQQAKTPKKKKGKAAAGAKKKKGKKKAGAAALGKKKKAKKPKAKKAK